jgi:hypothetical protein
MVYAPKFPKPQQESWFVLACDPKNETLLALQRLSFSGRSGGEGTTELTIRQGFSGESVVVKVLSDGWRGVDMEKAIQWKQEAKVDA